MVSTRLSMPSSPPAARTAPLSGTLAAAWAARAPCATGSTPASPRRTSCTSPPPVTIGSAPGGKPTLCTNLRRIKRIAPKWEYPPLMDTRTKIVEIVKQVAGKPIDPTPEESLFESGVLDSFTLADLVSALELE